MGLFMSLPKKRSRAGGLLLLALAGLVSALG